MILFYSVLKCLSTGHWFTQNEVDGTVQWSVWWWLQGPFQAADVLIVGIVGWDVHRSLFQRTFNEGGTLRGGREEQVLPCKG